MSDIQFQTKDEESNVCESNNTNQKLNRKKKMKKKAKKKKDHEFKIFNELVKMCVEVGWSSNCLPASIILSELFNKYNIDNEVKKGFILLSFSSEKYAMWHCWVETCNGQYDVSGTTTRRLFEHYEDIIKNAEERLSEIVPNGFIRNDMDNQEELETLAMNEKLWKKYKDNPLCFWDEPLDMKNKDIWKLSVSFRKSVTEHIHL